MQNGTSFMQIRRAAAIKQEAALREWVNWSFYDTLLRQVTLCNLYAKSNMLYLLWLQFKDPY